MADTNKLSASSDFPLSDGSNDLNASASLSNNESSGPRESLEGSATTTMNAAGSTVTPEMKNVQDLTRYVETLLGQMQDRFQAISDQVLSRIDDMGNRIDDLEKNIADLVTQSGVDGPPNK